MISILYKWIINFQTGELYSFFYKIACNVLSLLPWMSSETQSFSPVIVPALFISGHNDNYKGKSHLLACCRDNESWLFCQVVC